MSATEVCGARQKKREKEKTKHNCAMEMIQSSQVLLLAYYCCNELPQTFLLKTTQIYPERSGGQKSHWAKMELAGLYLLDTQVFSFFPASRGYSHCLAFWPLPPSSKPAVQHLQISSSYPIPIINFLSLTLTSCLPFIRNFELHQTRSENPGQSLSPFHSPKP